MKKKMYNVSEDTLRRFLVTFNEEVTAKNPMFFDEL